MENSLYYYLPTVGYAFCFLFVLGQIAAPTQVQLRIVQHSLAWTAFSSPIVLSLLSAWLVAAFALSTRWTVLGLFQTNDAHDFIQSVGDVARQGWFDTPRGRPLANLSWAGLLDLTAFNVTIAGYIVALFSAIGIIAVALAGYGTYPLWAALLAAVFLFDYFHEFFMGISSEMPGFVFGCAAAGALFQAARARSAPWFLAGFALFASGMLVRPGVMFLLPALLVWGIWWFARDLKGRAALILASVSILVALFAMNGRVAATVTPNSGGTFVNAADSWYAIFENGREALGIPPKTHRLDVTRWRQIYVDHPDIEALPRHEQTSRKKEIILQQLHDYPLAGMVGALLELKTQFFAVKLFRFVEVKPLRYLTYVFFLIGAGAGLRRAFRDPVNALHAAVFLATIASVPFMFGGESRGFAASVGLMSLTVAYGAVLFQQYGATLVRKVLRSAAAGGNGNNGQTYPMGGGTALILSTALPALFLVTVMIDGYHLASGSRARAGVPLPAAQCPAGETAIRVTLSEGAQVMIVPDGATGAGPRVFSPESLQTHLDWQNALAIEKARWRYSSANLDASSFVWVAGLARETGRAYAVQRAIDVREKGLIVVAVVEPRASELTGTGPVDICATMRGGAALVDQPVP